MLPSRKSIFADPKMIGGVLNIPIIGQMGIAKILSFCITEVNQIKLNGECFLIPKHNNIMPSTSANSRFVLLYLR